MAMLVITRGYHMKNGSLTMTQAKYIGGFTLKWVIYPFLRDQTLLFEGTFSVSGCVQ